VGQQVGTSKTSGAGSCMIKGLSQKKKTGGPDTQSERGPKKGRGKFDKKTLIVRKTSSAKDKKRRGVKRKIGFQ